MSQINLQKLSVRLTESRAEILKESPFFGRLLLNLSFGFADCSTAFTDMRRIVFDPQFAARLTDLELKFVMLHELMHCVLRHCTRSKGKIQFLYNVACDIVVNSLIFEAMGVTEMVLDGNEVMHLAPDGKEGREYTASEVYSMLYDKVPPEEREALARLGFDDHGVWDEIDGRGVLEDAWLKRIKGAAKSCGKGSGMPNGLKRYFKATSHEALADWRKLLHDYIQHDRSDYCFTSPDKRYQGDFILPSFQSNLSGERVEKLYFYVDTSGSISDEALGEAYFEINEAIRQVGSIQGFVSFFDTRVSEAFEFETVEQLSAIEPIGGGGTSFHAIFESLKDKEEDDLPNVIIIITDGYAAFPPEEAARGIPVLWMMVDSDVVPEWGVHIKIETP